MFRIKKSNISKAKGGNKEAFIELIEENKISKNIIRVSAIAIAIIILFSTNLSTLPS